MKEKSGCSGALFIFLSIANFIFAYFAYRGEHSAKPAKVISIINEKCPQPVLLVEVQKQWKCTQHCFTFLLY